MVELIERGRKLFNCDFLGWINACDTYSPQEDIIGLAGVVNVFKVIQVGYDSVTFQNSLFL